MTGEMKESKSNLMIFTLFLGYIMIYVDKLSIGVALVPIAKEFDLTTSQTGLVMSAFFLGYTFMQIPMGLLNNKIGSRKILVSSIVFIAIFMTLFGFGMSLFYFMAIRFMAGAIAHSGYPASASKEISLNLPLEKRTFAQGILLASSGIAGVIGPLLVSPLIENTGWRFAYYIMAGFSLAIALFLVLFLPKEHAKTSETTVVVKTKMPVNMVWKDSRVWILTICAFFINSLVYGFTSWLPTFFTSARGLSLTEAGTISSASGVFALVGALGGSYVVGKYFAGKEKQIIALFSLIGGIAMIGVYMLESVGLLILLLGVANFAMLVAFVTLMSMPLKLFVGERFSPSYATIGTGGVLGGVFAPIAIGELVRFAGGSFYTAFLFFLVMGVASGVVILFLKIKK
ncbi:MFS transporter [Carnobacterium gallinarum]|uniref:MFS transporter n=1 Tax=Carnobacterium gallinarum TaxID=2749 RepID=UPI00055817A4|nr:MFS transporter [Carnobacterium gallinarum]